MGTGVILFQQHQGDHYTNHLFVNGFNKSLIFPATLFWNVTCNAHIIAIVISAHHIAPFCGLVNYGEISNCSAHCTGVIILALAFYSLRYSLINEKQ